MKSSRHLSHSLYILLMLMLIQSCGVIEKRRYSGAWNLNLNLGGGKDKGTTNKTFSKKKAIAKLKQTLETVSGSIKLVDTAAYISMYLGYRYENNNGERLNQSLDDLRSSKQLKHFTKTNFRSYTPERNIESSYHYTSASSITGNSDELKNEPFSIIGAVAYVVMLWCLLGLVLFGAMSNFILNTIFICFILGFLCTTISEYLFKKRGALYKNKNCLVFDQIMMYLSCLGLFVYLCWLIKSIIFV